MKKQHITRVLAILAVWSAVLAAAGCNTTKGFGEDLEKAGSGIEHSAERHGADR